MSLHSWIAKKKWEPGRQGSGYFKILISQGVCKILLWDAYLLKYPEGSVIAEHVDKVEGWRHYRCNIVLKPAQAGGVFACAHPMLILPRLKIFRSDHPHSVSKIERGTRYLLSIGFCLKEK